jgi:hypothetical protein
MVRSYYLRNFIVAKEASLNLSHVVVVISTMFGKNVNLLS